MLPSDTSVLLTCFGLGQIGPGRHTTTTKALRIPSVSVAYPDEVSNKPAERFWTAYMHHVMGPRQDAETTILEDHGGRRKIHRVVLSRWLPGCQHAQTCLRRYRHYVLRYVVVGASLSALA